MTETETRDLRELISTESVTFSGLMTDALDIQDDCRDYVVSNVSSKNMGFSSSTCKLGYIPDELSVTHVREMTNHSMGQLCAKLGVPARYIDKCIDTGRLDLAADNMNSWIEDYGKDLFIREYKDTVRGVLSSRYSVLDTPDVLSVLVDVFGNDIRDYRIKGSFLTPERFHARIVQNEMMNIAGEDLFAGIQIDSSDVGRSVLEVKFMIFKQVCTNGLTISKGGGVLFRQKHLGIDPIVFRDNFKESMSRLPFLIEHSKELIEYARKDLDTYKTVDLSEEQLKSFMENIKLKTHLSDNGVEKVISLMNDNYGTSTWGFINSLTEVAQDYTLERRLEIEKYAGDLLVA